MRRSHARQRGVSLIEALVALAVMAFGILGIAGIQANLRSSSDTAKQRAEAVRVAQQMMEDRRGFVLLADDGVNPSYAGIASQSLTAYAGNNASYSRSVLVTPADTGRMLNLRVAVQWADRTGETQSVVLRSSVAGATPELSASLGTSAPGGAVRQPQGRNPGVPRQATDQGDGTSKFLPPGGSGQYWTFSNTTGVILRRCYADDTCEDGKAFLLSGFVRFSTAYTQPTGNDAELPGSAVEPGVSFRVRQTSPYDGVVDCFVDASSFAGSVAYYCAMPITDDVQSWSGRGRVGDIDLASNSSDDDDDEFRVCRYTRDLAHTTVGSGAPPMTNADHPRDYLNVDAALTNQNYLVIRAGDGSTAFGCPDDNTATPFISGRTFKHQPG
jgi:type IV pilus modification protein PilV